MDKKKFLISKKKIISDNVYVCVLHEWTLPPRSQYVEIPHTLHILRPLWQCRLMQHAHIHTYTHTHTHTHTHRCCLLILRRIWQCLLTQRTRIHIGRATRALGVARPRRFPTSTSGCSLTRNGSLNSGRAQSSLRMLMVRGLCVSLCICLSLSFVCLSLCLYSTLCVTKWVPRQ